MSASGFTNTPNLGLFKPIYGKDRGIWGDHWNFNADTLDAFFGSNVPGPFLPIAGGNVTGPTTFSFSPTGVINTFNLKMNTGEAPNGLYAGTMSYRNKTPSSGVPGAISAPGWVGLSDNGLMIYFTSRSLVASVPDTGDAALLAYMGATRTSDRATNTASIAYGAFNVSDTPNRGSWAFYGTSRRTAVGVGTSISMELSTGNLGETVELNPYSTGVTGSSIGLWLSSGSEASQAGLTVNPASAAIGIVSNGSRWAKGLVIGSNALAADAHGQYSAISLARTHEFRWLYDGSNIRAAFIRSDATSQRMGIVFTDTGISFVNGVDEAPLYTFAQSGGVTTFGSSTRNQVIITPGNSTSANSTLSGSGTGGLQITSPSTLFGFSSQNALIVTPGNAPTTATVVSGSGTGGVSITAKLGFNSATPLAKPTLTGAWAGNAAGKALSTILASYGLLTDSSTA